MSLLHPESVQVAGFVYHFQVAYSVPEPQSYWPGGRSARRALQRRVPRLLEPERTEEMGGLCLRARVLQADAGKRLGRCGGPGQALPGRKCFLHLQQKPRVGGLHPIPEAALPGDLVAHSPVLAQAVLSYTHSHLQTHTHSQLCSLLCISFQCPVSCHTPPQKGLEVLITVPVPTKLLPFRLSRQFPFL